MFARTRRLTLRPGWPEDAPALARAIGHESVVTKLARVPWPYGEADATQWLARAETRDDVTLLVMAHAGPVPRLIGAVGLHPLPDGAGHELGYWFTPDAWGRGYATEAGRAALGTARHAMGLRRLASSHFADNPASGRVLAKLGFRETGEVVQRHCLATGVERTCILLERDMMLRDERPIDRPLAA